jgi:hypothetical protein
MQSIVIRPQPNGGIVIEMSGGKSAIAIRSLAPAQQAHATERIEKDFPTGRIAAVVSGETNRRFFPGANEFEQVQAGGG